jgi:hypothetical protein
MNENGKVALTVFRIGNDGRLTFARKYVELGGKFQWRADFIGLPAA